MFTTIAVIILFILVGGIMATLEQFSTILSEVDAETTRIAQRIEDLIAQLTRVDLTEEQEAEILAEFRAAADRLKSIGVVAEDPAPDA